MSIQKRLIVFAIVIFLPLFLTWVLQPKIVKISGTTMGTTYSIKLYAPSWVTKSSIEKAVASELVLINNTFSTWDSNSEISNFNAHHSNEPFLISDDFITVYESSYNLFKLTSGYFDPTVKPLLDLWGFVSTGQYFNIPEQSVSEEYKQFVGFDKLRFDNNSITKLHPQAMLDFSSNAKGYAVDKIANVLRSFYSKQFMIEVGGEIYVTSKSDFKWIIGITEPSYEFGKQSMYSKLSLTQGAIASSGDYRNFFKHDEVVYSHIFDPITQKPITNNIAGVTIIAPTCMLADGLATSLMAMGVDRGLAVIEALDGVECLILMREKDKLIPYYSSGFDQYLIKSV